MKHQFTISESGYVYRRIPRKTNGKHRAKSHHRQLLGHVSALLVESTPLGDEIRQWWHEQYLPTVEAELRCSAINLTEFASQATSATFSESGRLLS